MKISMHLFLKGIYILSFKMYNNISFRMYPYGKTVQNWIHFGLEPCPRAVKMSIQINVYKNIQSEHKTQNYKINMAKIILNVSFEKP